MAICVSFVTYPTESVGSVNAVRNNICYILFITLKYLKNQVALDFENT